MYTLSNTRAYLENCEMFHDRFSRKLLFLSGITILLVNVLICAFWYRAVPFKNDEISMGGGGGGVPEF